MRAEGFFCNLDVLYEGLGIGKNCSYWSQKNLIFSAVIFLYKFLVIKPLDPDGIQNRNDIQSKTLDSDPFQMNMDPKPWSWDERV